MTRAAIWDMDGTLVDTAEQHFAAWVETFRALDRDFTRAEFAATFGRRNTEILSTLFPAGLPESEIQRIGDEKERLYREAAKMGVSLLPGAEALMKALHAAGWKQAIGSSAPRANLELILELTGIDRYLAAVVAAEDTTRGKPNPQVFLIAAARIGAEPARCVVFEDAPAGVAAARAARMKCVAVRFVGHHDEKELREAGADRVVTSLAELTATDVGQLL